MPLSDDLLAILVCPETRQPFTLASDDTIAALNARVADGSLTTRSGKVVTTALDGGLVREDGTIVYPISDGIPILLIEEGIPLE